MNTEIFDLQEKNEYLQGIIRQFQSGITDSQLKYIILLKIMYKNFKFYTLYKFRIEELKNKQETLRIKQSHLQNQCNRETLRIKNQINGS